MTWTQRAASEITAVTSVENYTFLWRQNHFSFGQTWGPGSWGTLHRLILPPEPQEGCAIRQFVVKALHALRLISCAAGIPHSFGRGRGIPKVFTEELLQETHCFWQLTRDKSHSTEQGWPGLGQIHQRHLQHQSFVWFYPLNKGVC